MNRFAGRMKVDADWPLQNVRFIGSYTSLRREGGDDEQSAASCASWTSTQGGSSRSRPGPGRRPTTSSVPRHTLMNPFLMDGPAGRSLHRHVLGRSGSGHRRRDSGRIPFREKELHFDTNHCTIVF